MTLVTAGAGEGRGAVLEAEPARTPLPRLGVLYSYESGEKAATRALDFARASGLRSILDSGAWSVFNAGAFIDPKAHAAYVNDIKADHPSTRFVGLDVIGDEEASYRNWMDQRALGAPVEPTVHFGSDPALVDRYLDAGLVTDGAGERWVNCGGMVAASSRPSWIRPTMAWVAAVRRRLPEDVKIHGLGMTTPAANDLVRFDSVDSTYWLVSYARFRNLPLFDPDKRAWILLQLMTSSAAYTAESRATFRGHGRLLRERYGVTAREVWGMTDSERLALSVQSHAYFADAYRARHRTPDSPIVYLAGAPSSPTAASGGLMGPISEWAVPGFDVLR